MERDNAEEITKWKTPGFNLEGGGGGGGTSTNHKSDRNTCQKLKKKKLFKVAYILHFLQWLRRSRQQELNVLKIGQTIQAILGLHLSHIKIQKH